VVAAVSAFALVLRPVVEGLRRSAADADVAQDIVRRHGSDTLSYFALRHDKSYFFCGDGFVAYRYLWNLGLVSGDPVCAPEMRSAVMEAFVRFARPTARILFSNCVVIAPFDGRLSLMFRVANLRHTSMAEAEFRMLYSRDEWVKEGEEIRRFYELKVYPERMVSFPAALIIRHTIDEQSPLFGVTPQSLEKEDAFFVASTLSLELVMAASVQSQQDYSWDEVRFGERFVDVYTEMEDGRLTVDYGRLHDTEPVAPSPVKS
jgi:hypothetical protein